MKKHLQLFAITLLLSFINLFVFAQATKPSKNAKPIVTAKPATNSLAATEKPNPFSKGTWNFTNRSNISYEKDNVKPQGSSRTSNVFINPKYFFTNHVAIGIDGRYNTIKTATGSAYLSTYYYYSAYLTLTYGTTISDKVNVYATVGAGPGHSKSFSNGAGNTTATAKYFGYYGSIGVPILLQHDGLTYFTPFVQYNKTNTKVSGHDIDEKGINIGLKLETYFNAAQFKKDKTDFSKGKYDQGSSFLEFNTMGNFSSTTRNEKQGTIVFAPIKRKNTSFGAGYYYYFIDNVAGGLNINFSSSKTITPGSSNSIDKTFILEPSVIGNMPSETALHNLFLQAGYGFGNANLSGLKRKVTEIDVLAGYNLFFGKNISLTPKIGYKRNKQVTTNGSSVGSYQINSGLDVELGVRTWLSDLWKHK